MRLIDADALKEWVEEYRASNWGIPQDELIYAIGSAPAIDAVPVVRCKDCRWKEQEQPGMVYCPATVGGWVDEDWFCKGGERSEE